jgi:hypothetical protein
MKRAMRRFARYGFTVFALISLAIGIAAFAFLLCGLAYRAGDRWIWLHERLDGVSGICTIWQGVAMFSSGTIEIDVAHTTDWRHKAAPSYQDSFFSHDMLGRIAKFDALPLRPGVKNAIFFYAAGLGLKIAIERLPNVAGTSWEVRVPLWLVVVICMVAPAIWEWRYRMGLSRLFRVRRGLCAVCGYDLRASSGRCPECGSAIGAVDSGSEKTPTASLRRSSG